MMVKLGIRRLPLVYRMVRLVASWVPGGSSCDTEYAKALPGYVTQLGDAISTFHA